MAMILFSIAAVLLSALAAALILQRAAGAARRPEVDPTLAVYRRQLTEIDDLAERGLLAEGELRTARAEASRRLLSAAEASSAAPASQPASRATRMAVLAGAVAAPLLALGIYVLLGSPGLGDQPFAGRLKAWTEADPSQLDAPRMAAVLETVVKSHPREVEPLAYLARAQAMSGNLPAAVAVALPSLAALTQQFRDLRIAAMAAAGAGGENPPRFVGPPNPSGALG